MINKTYIKGYIARQKDRQWREDKQIFKDYVIAFSIAIPFTAVLWIIAVVVLSI